MLGKLAKDKVTGVQGVIISKVEYLSGCVQYCIQPPMDKDGKFVESLYFDEGRVVLVSEKTIKVDKTDDGNAVNPGGPADHNLPSRYNG